MQTKKTPFQDFHTAIMDDLSGEGLVSVTDEERYLKTSTLAAICMLGDVVTDLLVETKSLREEMHMNTMRREYDA